MSLTSLEVKNYQLEIGSRYVHRSQENRYDLASWHRILLNGKPVDQPGRPSTYKIVIEFGDQEYIDNMISQGAGYILEASNFVLVRYHLIEFDKAYELLRSEKPVYFQFDRFSESSDPTSDRKRVHTAQLTTGKEIVGEGPVDLGN